MLLIDGHSMAFRSFYALPAESFRTASGTYTNSVHGFVNTLLRLMKDYDPSHIVVAFDLPGGTFRTRDFADYKGGRKATPEEFKGQISIIQELLDTVGISWLTVEDYEADDIVATLATIGAQRGMKVFIASGDKDSYQLVNDDISVLYPMPRSQMLVMTPQVVQERTNVSPQRYSDLAALVGEGADNIPGVPGVGPKTAVKWLEQYGDLEGILDHADEIKGKVGESLRAHIDQVRLNRKLNELVRDLPIGENFDDFMPKGVDRRSFHELCDALDFSSVRDRVLSEFPSRASAEQDTEFEQTSVRNKRTATAFDGGLADFLAAGASPIGMHVEGSFSPGQGTVHKFALTRIDGVAISCELSGLADKDAIALRKWLADEQVKKIIHGGKAAAHAWLGAGYSFAGIEIDTELQAYLLHPDQRKYDFAELVQRYLSIDLESDSDDSLGITMDGMLANDNLIQYAAAVLDLAEVFTDAIAKQGMSSELLDLELEVSRVLFAMENRGICVEQQRLEQLIDEFTHRVEDAAERAHMAVGDFDVNLSSPKQLQALLFDRLNLPKTKKTKSGYTTNADSLAELLVKIAGREDDDALMGTAFLAALLEHRDAIKLLQSVEGLQKSLQNDGRIHTTYQQTVAATGRLSSTEPNLQNIHARTDEGLQIREVFVPGEGFDSLMTADYSQIEMRLMAHLSKDASLIEAFNEGADLHSYVASRVFNVPEDAVSAQQRSKIKAMSYGLVYGLSAYGLSAQLGVSVPEATRLMDGYFSRFGKVKEYLDTVVESARKLGYTETIRGRRRYLPELTSSNRKLREAAERMALNAPIQGSAADLIKVAMLDVERALNDAGLKSRILLQVHDELVLEILDTEREQVEQIVREKMGAAEDLSVPLSVGVGIGKNWRFAAH
nr:DNA polymerase I [Arcanobacterium pluranimalium]